MTYPGGKNGAGIYQRIINNMPPHDIYVEAFLGSGAVLRNKRPARRNIGIDRSVEALDLCWELADQAGMSVLENNFVQGCALGILPSLKTELSESSFIDNPKALIYADPPYLMETRKGGDLYDFELSDDDHECLLNLLADARCMVMISGYRSALYDDLLSHFRRIDYQAQTRGGPVTESLWMNFKEPVALHDYSHLGDDFRERERIKRKRARWAKKFANMPHQERLAMMDVLQSAGQ